MKKEKNSKKGKENLVGKIIYSFLLFAPLLSILATCVYTIINENAKDSYYGETINEEQYTKLTNNTIDQNTKYRGELKSLDGTQNGNVFVYNFKLIYSYNVNATNVELLNTATIYRLYWSNDSQTVGIYKIEEDTASWIMALNYTTSNIIFECNLYNLTGAGYSMMSKITYTPYSFMDNVFEYSIYKVENNNLYNWAKTTGTYTVVQNTTQLLGITNTFIPMLLTYWLIISIIYIIYDIGLIMIWIAHNKMHELIESV